MINIEQLSEYGTVLPDEPMRYHTSMRVGGKVKYFITPNDLDSLIELISLLKDNNEPFMVLGRGSNVIFPDYDMELTIICIYNTLDYIEIEDNFVRVGAGYSMQKLAKKVSKLGLSGLEYAGGIPGTVAGAVYMNAGAHKGETKDIVDYVKTIDLDGIIHEYSNNDCQFSYRHSVFQEKDEIIIEVGLVLEHKDASEVFKRMSGNLSYRKELQPLELPSCGSVFKNPENNHAGLMIEQAGLKGYKIGGAEVSTKHANFIVNVNEAKSCDIIELQAYVQKIIKEQFGVELVSEIKIIKGIDARK